MRTIGVGHGRPREILRAALCMMSNWFMAEGDATRRTGAEYVITVLISAV